MRVINQSDIVFTLGDLKIEPGTEMELPEAYENHPRIITLTEEGSLTKVQSEPPPPPPPATNPKSRKEVE